MATVDYQQLKRLAWPIYGLAVLLLILVLIPGIGAKRKKALLLHFGSAQSVARAGLADLEQVAGISQAVAKKIYDHFHAQG